MVKMECPTCGYKWDRPANEVGKKICVKCQTPLDSTPATTRAPGEVSKTKVSPGTQIVNTGGTCSATASGHHEFKFGKCSGCNVVEGPAAKGKGAVANPGGQAGCAEGGKCTFKFTKCTKCGGSEF